MQHSAKYLIHADIRTSGVVERSDVVGAIFGQTEGLLGDELDLRDLQDASKIGRIDVDIESENGRSFGTVTIASGLDRVKTAVLAASLETIERVGPCRAECTVASIEDARAAKRRELVDRATALLADLEDSTMTSENLVDAVRQRARVEDITEYEGLPAGPRVADSDAIIVVEGRADVRRLLRFGIKNAIAVEGTDIPDAVARLTTERTTTALLDGDRGGDLILRELAQVGNVDYVAFAPPEESIEDLDRPAIMSALRKKVPYDQALDANTPREAFDPAQETGGSTAPVPESRETGDGEQSASGSSTEPPPSGDTAADTRAGDTPPESPAEGAKDGAADHPSASDGGIAETDVADAPGGAAAVDSPVEDTPEPATPSGDPGVVGEEDDEAPEESDAPAEDPADSDDETPQTLRGHVAELICQGSGRVRLLDPSFEPSFEGEAAEAFDAIAEATEPPETVVVDGVVSQRLLDIAAQHGVGQIIGSDAGEFVKQPTTVRVRTAEEFEVEA